MARLKRIVSGANAAILALSTLMTIGFTGVAHATGNLSTRNTPMHTHDMYAGTGAGAAASATKSPQAPGL